MTQTDTNEAAGRLRAALEAPASSARLQAALTAGSTPAPSYIDVLVERCAIEPDFYVRDMLTWALIRNDTAAVAERLRPELTSEIAQARAQALHTLSKIGEPTTWPLITLDHLRDEDDAVARTAWRAAARLVPAGEAVDLAEVLVTQFNRGDRETQLSLSRAFIALVALGADTASGPVSAGAGAGAGAAPAAATAAAAAIASVVERAKADPDPAVRIHAAATERLMHDPDEGFDAAMSEARRAAAVSGTPQGDVPRDAAPQIAGQDHRPHDDDRHDATDEQDTSDES
ncbi:HEAT repeat domain-containing protein [Plantibacter sp. YIM 135347]|uniref:HEAT repeat domain-containing protein n=1 Tax=Plantibacter sp. YIM 135347 TaxID=3423919 RepID=UPI003D33A362